MTIEELNTISKIAERAVALYRQHGAAERTLSVIEMATVDELVIVHREIVPLRLDDLLAARDVDFIHDIAGIHHHLEHGSRAKPARLTDAFLPRFANV